jgi:hypothetical protein
MRVSPLGSYKQRHVRRVYFFFLAHQQLFKMISLAVIATAILAGPAAAQTFRRSAACPNLGCIYPPVSSLNCVEE